MSTLDYARSRLDQAVARIERALAAGADTQSRNGQARDEIATLAADCELLRVECDRLRRALESSEAAGARLREAADQAQLRVNRSIHTLSEVLEG
jgi:chromosome segregation ATPase